MEKGRKGNKIGIAILAAFLTAILIKLFLFDFMITEGSSMLPSIKPGTIVLIVKTAYGVRLPWSGRYLVQWTVPKKGDVVVFYTPLGVTAIKRCAEVTGDQFFARGDNHTVSFDSASYGKVSVSRIIGKAWGVPAFPYEMKEE
ncbi:MAG: signal peptidase I [Treponema sp.]|jgi:signal peptidase I|nr:signal peptidase I [Treponema sp.]